MNLALRLIFLQSCFTISNSGSDRQSVKYYVLNSISNDSKLDKLTPVTFLRFHPTHSADPWKVYKKPTWERSGKQSLTTEENSMTGEKDILNGKVLRVTCHSVNVFIEKFLSKLCKALEETGNFTMHFVTGFGHSGFFNKTTKTWNGAIALLQNDQADISACLYNPTPERREVADISVNIITTKICLLIKRPSKEVILARSGYFKPFSTQAWCGILVLIFVATAVLTFMEKNVAKQIHYGRYIPNKFLQIWGLLCQQGLSEFPRTSSRGMVYYAIFFFGLFAYSIYSSLLLREIVSIQEGLPFSTMEEFARNKDYKLAVIKSSRIHQNVKGLEYYPYNIMMKRLIKEEDLPINAMALMEMVCRDKIAGGVYQFFFDIDRKNLNCSLMHICAPWPAVDFTLVFQKNSPYTQALNYNILKLKELGVFDRMFNSVYGQKRFSNEEALQAVYTGVTVSDICTLVLISFGSFVLPLIVLFFEKIHFWFYAKKTAVVRLADRRPEAARFRFG